MGLALSSLVYCIVGCHSGSPDNVALHVLECNTQNGQARIVQTVKGVVGTTYFQIDQKGKCLYTICSEERNGKKLSKAVAYALQNNRIGEELASSPLPCEAPCHVALSPNEKLFSFAAYLSATAGTIPLAHENGNNIFTQKLWYTNLFDVGMGPRQDRQQKAYAHCTFYTPDGKFFGVIDLGCDSIFFYDAVTMLPCKQMDIKADSGDGPRHAIFSKDGQTLFVLNELSSSVTSYAFKDNKFSKIGKWPMLPNDVDPLSTKAAAIKLTSDGKILMASNRGFDSIVFFAVNEDGSLEFKNRSMLKGRFPRDFELMPGEKFMVVGHKMSNEIQVYSFDRGTCALRPLDGAIECYRPLCFKFIP